MINVNYKPVAPMPRASLGDIIYNNNTGSTFIIIQERTRGSSMKGNCVLVNLTRSTTTIDSHYTGSCPEEVFRKFLKNNVGCEVSLIKSDEFELSFTV